MFIITHDTVHGETLIGISHELLGGKLRLMFECYFSFAPDLRAHKWSSHELTAAPSHGESTTKF